MPNHRHSIPDIQSSLLQTARELRAIDRRLSELAESIQPRLGHRLPDELRDGAHCVRNDLLSDAIETLEVLGTTSEESLNQRRCQVASSADLVAAFG